MNSGVATSLLKYEPQFATHISNTWSTREEEKEAHQ
jgi:hypothetical protein